MKYLFSEINPMGGVQESPCPTDLTCAFVDNCWVVESCGPLCITECNQLALNCSCTVQNGDVQEGCVIWFENK